MIGQKISNGFGRTKKEKRSDVFILALPWEGLPRSSVLEFVVKYKMSWPEQTTFLPPQVNKDFSQFFQSTYRAIYFKIKCPRFKAPAIQP